MDTDFRNSFISLLRLGIGHYVSPLPENINWQQVQSFANRQGLTAIVIDGIEGLPERLRPSKDVLLEWIGEVLQNYEYRYKVYCHTLADLAGFYHSHGFIFLIFNYTCKAKF